MFLLNLLKIERLYECTDNHSKRLRTGDASDWRNIRWMVKDLGGQNGTYVNRSLFHALFIKLHRKPSSLEYTGLIFNGFLILRSRREANTPYALNADDLVSTSLHFQGFEQIGGIE